MTRPARSETRVSGIVSRSVPLKSNTVIATSAAITTNRMGANQIGSVAPPRRGELDG
jgi:hypothetical protein